MTKCLNCNQDLKWPPLTRLHYFNLHVSSITRFNNEAVEVIAQELMTNNSWLTLWLVTAWIEQLWLTAKLIKNYSDELLKRIADDGDFKVDLCTGIIGSDVFTPMARCIVERQSIWKTKIDQSFIHLLPKLCTHFNVCLKDGAARIFPTSFPATRNWTHICSGAPL